MSIRHVGAHGRLDLHRSKASRAHMIGRCEGERHNVPSPHSPSKTGVNALVVGEGQGGGWRQTQHPWLPPSLSLPHKGGGNARAARQSYAAAGVPPTSKWSAR
jgi:hypothetical protein